MNSRFIILFFSFFIFSIESYAQSIKWNQPEVVPEKLYRENRRVLRFSGTANPGTQVRIRDNKVKMVFTNANVRWARIPQKHKVQFPVFASETGYLSFELYLPTTAVEIPLEIFRNGKWVPYRMTFDVPDQGKAKEFQVNEESFKSLKDDDDVKVEDFLSEYDKKEDMGQVVNDRGEWKSWVTGKIIIWGTLGLTYHNISEDVTAAVAPPAFGTSSGASFPSWEVGGEYRWNSQWKAEAAYINRAAKVSGTSAPLQNSEFNWTEFRAQLGYYPISFEKETSRWGLKGGLQMHDLPFAKQVTGTSYRIFNNDVTFLTIGANYETMFTKGWNYDATALFLYPVIVGNEFDVDSAYGLNASFSMVKEIIPALYLGGKIDAHWMTLATTHSSQVTAGTSVSADVKLWQLTPSFVLKAEF
jgi:hypothetical protein